MSDEQQEKLGLLSELRNHLITCRDLHFKGSFLEKTHPRYHPEHVGAYLAYDRSINALDNWVKNDGTEESRVPVDKEISSAHELSSRIVREVSGLHESSIDDDFRQLSNALIRISKILGKEKIDSSWY
jgi:hypothetical protein